MREKREEGKREERGGRKIALKLGLVTPTGLTRLSRTACFDTTSRHVTQGSWDVSHAIAGLSHASPLGAIEAYAAPRWHFGTRSPPSHASAHGTTLYKSCRSDWRDSRETS
jgi:hypothetical protein